jgi:enoyl-CoA hydratase/carnithine racemase
MTTDRHSAPTSGGSSPYDTYATLQVSVANGIAWVTLDNPPVNVLSLQLIADLSRFAAAIRQDEQVQVIVLQSANPDFFIAHVDMELVNQWEEAARVAAELFPEPSPLNVFQQLNEQWRTLPQITIGKLQGLVRCGGSELAMALDMRFAAQGQAGIGQTEALMGIVPGGGATAYLPRLIGRARALEAIAGANLFDADLAERYGWINRALPAGELDSFVATLAHQMAALAPGVARAAKQAVDTVNEPLPVALAQGDALWQQLVFQPIATSKILGGLAAGAQTPAGERDLEELLRRL